MYLKNSSVSLRAVEPEDLDLLYKWENDTSLWIHGNSLSPYSKLMLRQYINDAQQMDIFQSKQLRLMIDYTDENNGKQTVGTIDLYDIDIQNKRAGIGILVDSAYRNRSLAYQSLMLMTEYAFNFIHLHQLYAYIGVQNKTSEHLFLKAGYSISCVLKDWIQSPDEFEDVLVAQLLNSK